MASIIRQPNGRKAIQFTAPDRKRPTIALGKCSMRDAGLVRGHIEHLLAAKIMGHAVQPETATWVAGIEDVLADRLAAVGLIPKREKPEDKITALGPFLDSYIAGRTDVKPLTIRHLQDAQRKLVEYFGRDKLLWDITPGEADAWRVWLLQSLGPNTVRRKCGRAKQFFRAALRRRLIEENPFADMKDCSVRQNREREYFVSRQEADKVLRSCPDAQWRLLFALSRYGGLRCPSEHLSLRWRDVDWEQGRITIHSPKTEHHEGGESRVIPLFPELRPYLEAVYNDAEDGTEFVITRYRDKNSNLRTQLLRIIRKAGLNPWPKLFQNCRSTRQTELEEQFPSHVVCAWMGNSQPVARRHYLQVTDEHFQRAAAGEQSRPAVQAGAEESQRAAESCADALQNRMQHASVTPRSTSQKCSGNTSAVRVSAESPENWQSKRVPPLGLEPRTY